MAGRNFQFLWKDKYDSVKSKHDFKESEPVDPFIINCYNLYYNDVFGKDLKLGSFDVMVSDDGVQLAYYGSPNDCLGFMLNDLTNHNKLLTAGTLIGRDDLLLGLVNKDLRLDCGLLGDERGPLPIAGLLLRSEVNFYYWIINPFQVPYFLQIADEKVVDADSKAKFQELFDKLISSFSS